MTAQSKHPAEAWIDKLIEIGADPHIIIDHLGVGLSTSFVVTSDHPPRPPAATKEAILAILYAMGRVRRDSALRPHS